MNLEEVIITCPFCYQSFTTLIDPSEPNQKYTEDCYVCCHPILLHIKTEDGQVVSIDTEKEY